ncbi:MAG: AAC(3) family N-acetyltransferase [Pseudomonadota bacterium]
MNDIKKRIRDIMGAVFKIDPTEIEEDAGAGVIEKWDSLGHMILVLALEEEFNIRFPDEMIEKLLSLKSIELILKESLSPKFLGRVMNSVVGRLTEQDFRVALESVIRPEDEVLVFFSAIYTFGHLFAWPPKEIPDRLLDIMIHVAGSNRTLILPAYTLSFPRTRVFDLVRTKSDTGILSDRAILRRSMRRLPKPMNSYMVIGPRADEFLALPCSTAWGTNGAFGWMTRVDAKICMLGVPWGEACSLYHYAEELEQVPYRYYKRFSGDMFEDGVPIGPCEEVMFVRSATIPPVWNHAKVYPQLRAAGVVITSENPVIPLEAVKASKIVEVTRNMLKMDPYAYVANVEQVRAWVKHDASEEVERLTPGERFTSQS